MKYLFLDTETTGLQEKDQIWQLAWQLDDAEKRVNIAKDNVLIAHEQRPSAWTLKETQYAKYFSEISGEVRCETLLQAVLKIPHSTTADPIYLVGNNPAFDERMMRRQIGDNWAPPWNYHVIPVEILVMGRFIMDEPKRREELAKFAGLRERPSHEAYYDMKTTRELFYWWKDISLPTKFPNGV